MKECILYPSRPTQADLDVFDIVEYVDGSSAQFLAEVVLNSCENLPQPRGVQLLIVWLALVAYEQIILVHGLTRSANLLAC